MRDVANYKNIIVGKDCIIEDESLFDQFMQNEDISIEIGDNVTIYAYTKIKVEKQGKVKIGDGSILAGAVIVCHDRIKIGKNVGMSYYSMIIDSDFHSKDPAVRKEESIQTTMPIDDVSMTNLEAMHKPVVIGNNVVIGAYAMILKGVTVGSGSVIFPGTVVSKDVPDNSRAEGNPAIIYGL